MNQDVVADRITLRIKTLQNTQGADVVGMGYGALQVGILVKSVAKIQRRSPAHGCEMRSDIGIERIIMEASL
jgi:hypothetical protein